MDREMGIRYAKAINNLEGKEYITAIAAVAAAPTIHGKKPASLLSFRYSARNTAGLWRKHGAEICEMFRLEEFELKNSDNGLMVLLYKKKLLEQCMRCKRNEKFLNKMGYGAAKELDSKLSILKQRFTILCPHEVGIFLGMPVKDVEGFIEHKGANYIACRYWKVYGDLKRAESIFDTYDKARSVMVGALI